MTSFLPSISGTFTSSLSADHNWPLGRFRAEGTILLEVAEPRSHNNFQYLDQRYGCTIVFERDEGTSAHQRLSHSADIGLFCCPNSHRISIKGWIHGMLPLLPSFLPSFLPFSPQLKPTKIIALHETKGLRFLCYLLGAQVM